MPKHPLGLRIAARPKMTNRVLGHFTIRWID
jgi:hypothetical protein